MRRLFVVGCGVALAIVAACVGSDPTPPNDNTTIIVEGSDGAASSSSSSSSTSSTSSSSSSGSPSDAAIIDAYTDPPCNAQAPFLTISALDGINSGADELGPSLSPDESELVYSSSTLETDIGADASSFNLVFAGTDGGKFVAPTSLDGPAVNLNITKIAELDPAYSPDRRSLYYYRQEWIDGGRYHHLLVGTRMGAATVFTTPAAVKFNGIDISTSHPRGFSVPIVGVLCLVVDTGSGTELARATMGADPTAFGDYAAVSDDTGPIKAESVVVDASETVMYVGEISGGKIQVAAYLRDPGGADPRNGWHRQSFPIGITSATGSSDIPRWLSPDLCRLYFTSNRSGGKGNHDLWLARKR
jgi:hypothetical protein